MGNYTAKGLRKAVQTLLPHIKAMNENGISTNISSDLNEVGLSYFKKHFHSQESIPPEHKDLYEMCWSALKDLSEHGQFMYSVESSPNVESDSELPETENK